MTATQPAETTPGQERRLRQSPGVEGSVSDIESRTGIWTVQRGFFRIGWLDLTAYPASFFLQQLSRVSELVIYLFVGRLIADTPAVGNDYYSFVVVGLLLNAMLNVALVGIGSQMDRAVQQGRLEALLVQPVSWTLLPFGMIQFFAFTRFVSIIGMAALALAFGARFEASALPAALLVATLGVVSSLALGLLGTSIRLLTKRSDPVISLYTMVAGLFAGVWFPLSVLPGWLQPVAYALPHTYVISGVRRLVLADSSEIAGPSLTLSIVALTVFSLVMYPLALFVYRRVLETARGLGVLAGY